jgi:putative endonuclease
VAFVFWVYILRSESSRRYYWGSTDDVEKRIHQHNDPDYTGSKTTKRFAGPWKLVSAEIHETRGLAMKREKQIKSVKSSDFSRKLSG